jgi:hypothetical protein
MIVAVQCQGAAFRGRRSSRVPNPIGRRIVTSKPLGTAACDKAWMLKIVVR